jgi:hypothetical protein
MEGDGEAKKEVNMSQLAGVQFLLNNEGKVRGIIVFGNPSIFCFVPIF